MDAINLEAVIGSRFPGFLDRMPPLTSDWVPALLKRILHLDEINRGLELLKNKKGLEFIEELFDYLNFSYLLSGLDRKKIPSEGRLICVANHPLGGLDGLAILKALGEIRPDVKIVVNDVLLQVKNLADLFLPYDIFSSRNQRRNIVGIKNAILDEQAVIFFPSAEVSRLGLHGIQDGKWHNGAAYFASKYEVPVLPVYVQGKNSLLFYLISLLNKRFSMFLLPGELYKLRSRNIRLKIGDPIPGSVFKKDVISVDTLSRLMRSHVYRIGKDKPGIFKTEKTIIHPVEKTILKKEFAEAPLLFAPAESKKVFLVNHAQGKNILTEIARLREITFRRVGEGTGEKMDFDLYDRNYAHIVLWDEENLEIMGAYRLAICKDILKQHTLDDLYTSTLFNYSARFCAELPQSIELGRSFIHYSYWRSNALHYLWKGIGALLNRLPDVKYLYGAVSISNTYSDIARSLIVHYYKKWYGVPEKYIHAKFPFRISREMETEVNSILMADTPEEDYRTLKEVLKNYGFAIPILFKQYTGLCEPGGVRFHDFCEDSSFKTVDGLVVLEIAKIMPSKRKLCGLNVEQHSPDNNVYSTGNAP
ncbi:MAG: hypothetical protein QG657_2279 [Acidobacteriota bacterium]|nr:hypothetical protein [Acidobacteriota bacterium]